MDPINGILQSITKLSFSVTTFILAVRQARSDLDGISRELLSLKTILELLNEDLSNQNGQFKLPESLRGQITGIVQNCSKVLKDIEDILAKHSENALHKKAKWALSDSKDAQKLRVTLEAHKSALEIALDMVQL